MTTDLAAELMRHMLREALIIAAPILIAAGATSLLLSLVQTLTSLQDQTLNTVPRIVAVVVLILGGTPWFLHRLVWYTVALFEDFHRFLG